MNSNENFQDRDAEQFAGGNIQVSTTTPPPSFIPGLDYSVCNLPFPQMQQRETVWQTTFSSPSEYPFKCPCCDGWGKRREAAMAGYPGTIGKEVDCPSCKGAGVLWR